MTEANEHEKTADAADDEVKTADATDQEPEPAAESEQAATSTDAATARGAAGPPREPDRPAIPGADSTALTGRSTSRVGPRVALPGIVAATVGFALATGPVGIVGGLLVAGFWVAAQPVYAAAAGTGVLAVLDPGLPALAVGGIGLGLVLCAPLSTPDARTPRWTLGAVCVVAAVLGGVLFLALDATSLLFAAGVLVGTVALGLYALHRVALVSVVYPSTTTEQEPTADHTTD